MPRPDAAAWPYLVFLFVCVIYLVFPSNHFNADGLHYNLLAFMSLDDPAVVLRDEAVSVHPLWHLCASAGLLLMQPVSPEESLYLLRLMNVVLALASIFVFMRLVRKSAGQWAAAWATVILAFSQACLRHFLSVEVYALNNLVLLLILSGLHHAAQQKAPPGPVTAALFALLSVVAIAAHLSNALLVVPMFLFFVWRGREGRPVVAATYLLTLCLLGALGAGAMAWLGGRDLGGTIAYLLTYSGKQTTYLSSGILRNLAISFRSVPEAILARSAVWLYVPVLLFGGFMARRWTVVWNDLWSRFLILQLGLMLALITQWDPENMEHKIACIPVMLLLVTRVRALVAPQPRAALAAGAGFIAAAVAVAGLALGVRPYTQLEDYAPYRAASRIRQQSTGDRVVLMLPPNQSVDSVALASMTFFRQRVVVLDSSLPDAADEAGRYRDRGFEVLEAMP